MKKGIEIYENVKADYIIGTGGFGFFNRSKKALGQLTKDYLLAQGIPKDRILFEGTSTDTIENLEAIIPLLKAKDIKKIIVVTSVDHMPRTKYLAKRIIPKNIDLNYVISDYYSTLKVTVWDFFWHLGGWGKLVWKKLVA